ncbi:CHASE3 domain-containing protein [Siccirubricoccus sp. KC 17139]|uniref:histidine kinase n=1 Tax=Siccirubricoccus soli TaxID=2899147 RepID=A0ABT1D464_9PROT|nr:CHASE3 domain-containing protein [Siccirubricoccus soli]MCO6416718.1 CHASE3 domain-containing protein [Siccirubricoccus soli]MCP2682853.1 CHASE3 domain-containing protein [Siccirubricoccus soli]
MPLTRTLFGRLTLVLMAAGFAALIAIGASLIWLVESTRGFADAVNATQNVRLASLRVLSLLQDAETGQRGYLLTGERSYLEPYNAAVAALPEALPDLTARVIADGGVPGPVQALEQQAREKLAELAQTIALFEAGQRQEALAAVRSERGRQSMDEIRAEIDGLERRSDARLAGRSAALERNGRMLLLGAALVLGLMFLVAVGAAVVSHRYLRELEAAHRATREANEGLEARVAERTAALAAANAEIQRFAYIVSHDLRAPLVNVMGFTAELESGLAELRSLLQRAKAEAPALVTDGAQMTVEEDLPEAIGFIRSSTERMDRLINAILRLSREGRRALRPERVAVAAMVETIIGSLQHQLDAAGATATAEPGLPELVTDRLALEQILGNLIDNAVKYLDPSRPGRITVSGVRRGRQVTLEVADNGRGIDPRDHDRVFELFRRSGRQDQKGEGIGLAHVRALARRMGGEVTLESTPGVGSRFRLTLPAILSAQPAIPEGSPP